MEEGWEGLAAAAASAGSEARVKEEAAKAKAAAGSAAEETEAVDWEAAARAKEEAGSAAEETEAAGLPKESPSLSARCTCHRHSTRFAERNWRL